MNDNGKLHSKIEGTFTQKFNVLTPESKNWLRVLKEKKIMLAKRLEEDKDEDSDEEEEKELEEEEEEQEQEQEEEEEEDEEGVEKSDKDQ